MQKIRKNKSLFWSVWYIHLKTENYCLKTCVKICTNKKVCENTYNIV